MNQLTSSSLVIAIALSAVSCVTTEVAPPPSRPETPSRPPHHDDSHAIPPISWGMNSHGLNYDLDIIVVRDEYHIADGGESMSARRVSRTSRDVPPGTVSAFEVLLPDGEIDLYWVEEGRPGTLVVFSKFYDAYDRTWSRERRLRSITY